jgi:membrane-associated HD superfamily phosphohydrolase
MELRYMITVAVLLVILVASFVPIVLLPADYHAVIEIALFFPRFLVTVALVFFFLMATVFNKKERNGLSSARRTLQLIRDQDILPMLQPERRLDALKPMSSGSSTCS